MKVAAERKMNKILREQFKIHGQRGVMMSGGDSDDSSESEDER
jgi:hypothetical protein